MLSVPSPEASDCWPSSPGSPATGRLPTWRWTACSPTIRSCWLGGEFVVDGPLGREEEGDRLGGGGEAGLDPLAGAGQFGGGFAAVLVGLAEQALAVDGVQRPSPQTR